jgi:hypothetical protein
MTYQSLIKAKLEVQRTVKADYRIKEITNIQVNAYDRQVSISCNLSTKLGDYSLEFGLNIGG